MQIYSEGKDLFTEEGQWKADGMIKTQNHHWGSGTVVADLEGAHQQRRGVVGADLMENRRWVWSPSRTPTRGEGENGNFRWRKQGDGGS